ncbi:uncharacterized protein Z518_11199 [Rhinocladiella mackenziei CBS 650.93]|uniref:Azaphilone pigments biosynthesis cluster protein L N-terminal domain-containing protein n=1 Tax=Rhinocladiella mackenziei CBS 650.93 TaxID=1442369 RepID=A0A0D2I898_9EURO|nr:uncharacterized protein Z518_11199 [Rhinocladiella mackenziei CBS 650.93]KIW99460.1 hypothetical protein Z518_11199 [Rhinocladiella mackenziei CBS 650.93]
MEPLSITGASVGLLSSIFSLTQAITRFASGVRDARKDMESTRCELSALELAVETLQKDALSDELQYPDSLQHILTEVLLNCDGVVKDIRALLVKADSDRRMARVRWAINGQTEMNKLRQQLEDHKATLNIALGMANICLRSKGKEDTSAIRIGTVDIKQDTTTILDQILKLQLRFEDVGNVRTITLQRFLDKSTTYAQSIIDPVEELPSIMERPSSPESGEVIASIMPIQDSVIDVTAAKRARDRLSFIKRARLDRKLLTICKRTPPDFKAAESVLREGANRNFVGWFRNTGRSSLTIAAEFGTVELVTVLLGWGQDIDLQDKYGVTALMANKETTASFGRLALQEDCPTEVQ